MEKEYKKLLKNRHYLLIAFVAILLITNIIGIFLYNAKPRYFIGVDLVGGIIIFIAFISSNISSRDKLKDLMDILIVYGDVALFREKMLALQEKASRKEEKYIIDISIVLTDIIENYEFVKLDSFKIIQEEYLHLLQNSIYRSIYLAVHGLYMSLAHNDLYNTSLNEVYRIPLKDDFIKDIIEAATYFQIKQLPRKKNFIIDCINKETFPKRQNRNVKHYNNLIIKKLQTWMTILLWVNVAFLVVSFFVKISTPVDIYYDGIVNYEEISKQYSGLLEGIFPSVDELNDYENIDFYYQYKYEGLSNQDLPMMNYSTFALKVQYDVGVYVEEISYISNNYIILGNLLDNKMNFSTVYRNQYYIYVVEYTELENNDKYNPRFPYEYALIAFSDYYHTIIYMYYSNDYTMDDTSPNDIIDYFPTSLWDN